MPVIDNTLGGKETPQEKLPSGSMAHSPQNKNAFPSMHLEKKRHQCKGIEHAWDALGICCVSEIGSPKGSMLM